MFLAYERHMSEKRAGGNGESRFGRLEYLFAGDPMTAAEARRSALLPGSETKGRLLLADLQVVEATAGGP